MFNFDISEMLQNFIVLFTAITVHEYSHGKVAHMLGDPTAKAMGRLTLNPLAHLDPLGALMMVFCRFGWAKPVPVNPYYFNEPKKGMVLVSIAGPAANIVLAFMFATLMPFAMLLLGFIPNVPYEVVSFIISLFVTGIIMNVYFAVFNLIPFPPLDGSKILFSVLPNHAYNTLLTYERYGTIVLLALSFTGILGRILSVVTMPVINLMLSWNGVVTSLINSFF